MLVELIFSMMGLKYLPEPINRMMLWRNTIQLFYEYKRPFNFIGPFKKLGYGLIIERPLMTREGKDKKPDIIASGKTGWIVLELTTSQKSKQIILDSYQSLDPRLLGQYGLQIHKTHPDVISSRLSYIDDGPYCQIMVKDIFDLRKEDYLQDTYLKKELTNIKEKDLRKLPEIPISFVPEMPPPEIRRGLVEIILQLFEPDNEGKKLYQIIEEGLERTFEFVGPSERKGLMTKIENELDVLIKNHLSKYLEYKDETYRATKKFKPHHKTMEFIALELKKWAGETLPTTLNHFPNNS
ncbi:MAG: hypothetical protein JSV32_01265 [Dehalococcoidia bacterium]|nr:MAG: hypothetical protein JSV32_01265 [Dehalococcoidia bacterium]